MARLYPISHAYFTHHSASHAAGGTVVIIHKKVETRFIASLQNIISWYCTIPPAIRLAESVYNRLAFAHLVGGGALVGGHLHDVHAAGQTFE